MIELLNLEFHAAHACNLYCAQCSHYSNFHAGGIVSLDEARANFDAWKGRLAPKRIAILGGEPTLNPELISIIELARQSFPNAEGLFVTNGFFLDRHPDLPRVLIDNRFRMDVSQHGHAPEYMRRFRVVCQQIREWRANYPDLQLFRDYQACPPSASADEVRDFLAIKEIPQCGLCPAKKIPFNHFDPTERNS